MLLTVSLLMPVLAGARPLRLRLGWDQMQLVASHAVVSPRVVVWLEPGGRKRVKGHLVEITDSRITLRNPHNNNPQTQHRYVSRQDVHTVRLMPEMGGQFKGHPYGWRYVAIAVAFPVWFTAFNVGLAIPDGIPEGRMFKNRNTWKGLALATPLPYLLYRAARNADRRKGAIFIELDH